MTQWHWSTLDCNPCLTPNTHHLTKVKSCQSGSTTTLQLPPTPQVTYLLFPFKAWFMAVSLNKGQCIISGPLSSHFKVTVSPSQRTNYNFNSTQATGTYNYMYIYRKAISMMHVTPYQHSDSVFLWPLFIMESGMELNDYEYKMDSSFDTTDSWWLWAEPVKSNQTNEQEVQTCL